MALEPDQLKAIDVLLIAPTYKAAAKRVGVSTSTLRRWMRQDEFLTELKAAQRLAISQNVRGVASLAKDAISTLRALMRTGADEEIRLKAAQEAMERLFDADLVLRADEDSQSTPVSGTS